MITGTYTSYIDVTVDNEPITYSVMVTYEYQPGEYHSDPQRCIGSELNTDSVKIEFADGLWAEVDPEYRDGIVEKLNPEFQRFLDRAWAAHLDDLASDRADDHSRAAGF